MEKNLLNDPLTFVRVMWGLEVERNNDKFVKGNHVSWQQEEILEAFGRAIRGEDKKRISVSSGHGIGKSCTLAWLLIFFMFGRKHSRIGATAPSAHQMHDVLWAECKKWIQKMPKQYAELFQWTGDHIRIAQSPQTWYARARTARKEAPEALAGLHEEHVLYIVDEASGVPDEIYNTVEGALTDKNAYIIMTSNPTRLQGYFYESHARDGEKDAWKRFVFSCLDSPVLDAKYVRRIADKHGTDSDEYRIRVLGKFPTEDAIDDKGYVPLINPEQMKYTVDHSFAPDRFLGVDPAGEGDDETIWVMRDQFKSKIVGREKTSNVTSVAEKTKTLMTHYEIPPENVVVDNFGAGANIGVELAMSGDRVNCVNVGQKSSEPRTFLNQRAEAYWKMREWVNKGGEFVQQEGWDELLTIRYRRELNDKIKIKTKKEMKKDDNLPSPNIADALMLTFAAEFMSQQDMRAEMEYNEMSVPDDQKYF